MKTSYQIHAAVYMRRYEHAGSIQQQAQFTVCVLLSFPTFVSHDVWIIFLNAEQVNYSEGEEEEIHRHGKSFIGMLRKKVRRKGTYPS